MSESKLRRILDREVGVSTEIGIGFKLIGNLYGNGRITLYGEIVGNCDIDGQLVITEKGNLKGKIQAHDVLISGLVEGDVAATCKVELRKSARVIGNIRASEIAVEEGANIEGDINTQENAPVTRFIERRANSKD